MSVAAARQADVGVERECPACGGRGFRDWHIADGLSTHTCQSCGLILGSLRRRYAKLGQYENVDLPAYMSSVGALRDEQSLKILSFVRPYARQGARVLDIGCGFGSFLQRARQAGYAVAGVEPDAHACAGACEALPSVEQYAQLLTEANDVLAKSGKTVDWRTGAAAPLKKGKE